MNENKILAIDPRLKRLNVLSNFIDIFILIFIIFSFATLNAIVYGRGPNIITQTATITFFLYPTLIQSILVYKYGGTIGQIVMNIKVVGSNNEKVGFLRIFFRECLKFILLLSCTFGLLDFVVMLTGRGDRYLHDMIFRTGITEVELYTLRRNNFRRVIKFILLVAVVLLFLQLIYLFSKVNINTNDEITQQPFDEIPRESVDSPSGENSALLIANDDKTAILEVNNEIIDNNVIYFEWADDNNIFYIQNNLDNTKLISFDKSQNTKRELLVLAPAELIGFELTNNSIIYTAKDRVGYVQKSGEGYKVIYTFNPPISNSDHEYIPNIIPSEDKQTVTVEIQDEHYWDNGIIWYLLINDSGRILSRESLQTFIR
jgi:uncharacterized RDD family membrane protein YckC